MRALRGLHEAGNLPEQAHAGGDILLRAAHQHHLRCLASGRSRQRQWGPLDTTGSKPVHRLCQLLRLQRTLNAR